jgi:low temperature requirement protein LtrA
VEYGGGVSLTGAERRTSPVELLWDLAFVYAVTQVTALLVHHLTWTGFFHGMVILALAIDYAGPAWLTRAQLRGLQRVAVAHFAERYGLFVIICLGESIVAIGLAANESEIGSALIAAVGLLC